MALTDMGTRNTKWGVCGFCGALYALYAHSPTLKHSKLSTLATSDAKFVDEIRNYLGKIYTSTSRAMIADIGTFCRSFKGFEGFSVPEYLRRARAATESNPGSISEDFSIGLPPSVVVHYMKSKCDFRSARVVDQAANRTSAVMHTMTLGKDYVVGIRTVGDTMTMYGGLDHYIYRAMDGRIHSWGQVFADFDDLNAKIKDDVEMCTIISVTG